MNGIRQNLILHLAGIFNVVLHVDSLVNHLINH